MLNVDGMWGLQTWAHSGGGKEGSPPPPDFEGQQITFK